MSSTDIIAVSEKMKKTLNLARYVAEYDSYVLLQGETGTGKELIAKFIHENSSRRNLNFVKVNCPSVPAELFESELFGYEPGTFTGAREKGKVGVVELADKGTLLLDEIGDLPLDLQPKLLRVLQEKELYRVGSDIVPTKIDVRFISATNKDLAREVELGNFRSDLYHRLNVMPIYIPPLRERPEDVEALIDIFLERLNRKYNRNIVMNKRVKDALVHYSYPGNVRELQNLIEYLFITSAGGEIILRHIPPNVISEYILYNLSAGKENIGLDDMLEAVEKEIIEEALSNNLSIRQAAKELGFTPSTLWRRLQKYGITIDDRPAI